MSIESSEKFVAKPKTYGQWKDVVQPVLNVWLTYQSEGWRGNLIQWCRTTGAGLLEEPERRVLKRSPQSPGGLERALSGVRLPSRPAIEGLSKTKWGASL
jgi:hypothetical protein